MLIWRGWGFVAILILGIAQAFVGEYLFDTVFGIPEGVKHYRDAHPSVYAVCGILAAIGCWVTGTWLENREIAKGHLVVDKETGQEIRLVGRNDMFWIPVKWWSVIWLVFGFVWAAK